MANEFTRVCAKSSAISLPNINSNKATSGDISGKISVGASSTGLKSYIPIYGYKRIAAYTTSSGGSVALKWQYTDDTESADIVSLTFGTWTDYFNIPSNAKSLVVVAAYSSTTYYNMYLSILS